MSNPFYTALEAISPFSEKQIQESAKQTVHRFDLYLRNTIKALENKEVSCHWKPLCSVQYRMFSRQKLFEVTPCSIIELKIPEKGWFHITGTNDGHPLPDDWQPNLAFPIAITGMREPYTVHEKEFIQDESGSRMYIPHIPAENTDIMWGFDRLTLSPMGINLAQVSHISVDGTEYPVERINDQSIRVFGRVVPTSRVSLNKAPVDFSVRDTLSKDALKGYKYTEKGTKFLILSTDKSFSLTPHQVKDVTNDECSLLRATNFSGGQVAFRGADWEVSWNKKEQEFLLTPNIELENPNAPAKLYCQSIGGFHFDVEEIEIEEKWIQLIEKESDDDTGKSTLDYFFDENISIIDASKKNTHGRTKFAVLNTRFEERQILLAPKRQNGFFGKSAYPHKNDLFVSVDISQLKKQRNSLKNMQNRPMLEHMPLLHLCLPKEKYTWPNFSAREQADITWKVLTDLKYHGCDKQREFVCKALETPDFAILDGPPGTGKTTTILELIAQLVMEGKRVLLSASTHAAINNVLERVSENERLKNIIFPLRIGDKDNARGVEEYQYDELLKKLVQDGMDNSPQLLVDSANLVCGTTIGILRLFREEKIELNRGVPPFDVMIIDECSKTTFQEFLVPALYAQRWILVGDVRQLSPFTDRDAIIANLNHLQDYDSAPSNRTVFSSYLQEACFLLEITRGSHMPHYSFTVPMIIPVSTSVIQALDAEIAARLNFEEYGRVLLVSQKGSQNTFHWSKDRILKEPIQWYTHTCFFVEESIIDSLQHCTPVDTMVLHDFWLFTPKAFEVAKSQISSAAGVLKFRLGKKREWGVSELQQALLKEKYTRSWSEEVCWRLERLYWLRLADSNRRIIRNYKKDLERLYPRTFDVRGGVQQVEDLAFPSILEALSGDGFRKTKKEKPSTLNQGFEAQERAIRHTTLTHQHRMHPDISSYPRKQFYQGQSLLDGNHLQRDWTYTRYPKRNTWLNVEGKVHKNHNTSEVKSIIKELKFFCDWASTQSQKRGGYDVAILTFYKGQEAILRKELQRLATGQKDKSNTKQYSRFSCKGVSIKLATVDYFQGQEADVVFLSMVNTYRDGFTDAPNRLNVAITRARFQLVIVGRYKYFSEGSKSDELRGLARSSTLFEDKGK